jgi:hypothetical protein
MSRERPVTDLQAADSAVTVRSGFRARAEPVPAEGIPNRTQEQADRPSRDQVHSHTHRFDYLESGSRIQTMSTSTVSPTEYVPRHKFPVLDTDPHFKRVIRYMRSTDLAAWLGFTVGVPGLLYAWGE